MNFPEVKRKRLAKTALWTACALGLAACGPKAANLSIMPTSQTTFQGNTANNKVDILWVVDNSGSMLTKQQNLANGFNSFSSVFVNKGFDFNMAIITSDMSGTGQNGEFQGAPSVISGTTLNFATVFQNNILVGQGGDSAAKELDAIEMALSTNHLNGVNTGFIRSDAHLAVIVLSDADDNDSNPGTTTSVLSTLQTLKPDKFDVVSRTYKKNFTVSAVAVNSMNDSDCFDLDHDGVQDFPDVAPADGIPDIQLYEVGDKFKTLVNATSGSFASICKADFSDGLSSISQKIAEAITEIALARTPDSSTLRITFNGANVPNDATNGFTYSPTGNKIVFHGNYIPQDNTSIGIYYTPNDIIR